MPQGTEAHSLTPPPPPPSLSGRARGPAQQPTGPRRVGGCGWVGGKGVWPIISQWSPQRPCVAPLRVTRAYGVAEEELVAKRPVSLIASAPRIVRVGDEYFAGVTVTAGLPGCCCRCARARARTQNSDK